MASFDEVIPPGKAGTIKASIHTAAYKGPIGKQITVTHDDKSQGPFQLNVSATIVGSVEILPFPALQLARKRRGFATPALLLVRKDATEQGTFALTGLSASAPWLKVSARMVTSDEQPLEGLPAAKAGDVVISVQAAPDTPIGNHSENLTFKTGLTREPEVSVPVTVYVQAPITLQPPELVITELPSAPGKASGQVLGAFRDDVDGKSIAAASDSNAFVVRVESSGATAFRLFVDWTAKGKHPALATKIHVKAGKEKVDLPVRVTSSRAGEAP